MKLSIYDEDKLEILRELEKENLGLILDLSTPGVDLCKLVIESGVFYFDFDSEQAFLKACSRYSYFTILCIDLNLEMTYLDFRTWLRKSTVLIDGKRITEEVRLKLAEDLIIVKTSEYSNGKTCKI